VADGRAGTSKAKSPRTATIKITDPRCITCRFDKDEEKQRNNPRRKKTEKDCIEAVNGPDVAQNVTKWESRSGQEQVMALGRNIIFDLFLDRTKGEKLSNGTG
jgi:hypothetical protein